MSIQNIDLTEFYDVNIHCPFCGDKVIDFGAENSEEAAGTFPCKHTLYIASDEAWEYQSETFNKHLGLVGVDLNEVGWDKDGLPEQYKDLSIFELIEQIKIPDSLNISQHVGPPAMMVGYIGFYPMYED